MTKPTIDQIIAPNLELLPRIGIMNIQYPTRNDQVSDTEDDVLFEH